MVEQYSKRKGGEAHMATIVNNPSSENTSCSSMVLGFFVLAVVLVAFLLWGLQAMRSAQPPAPQVPETRQNNSQTMPTVPGKIDVNIYTSPPSQ